MATLKTLPSDSQLQAGYVSANQQQEPNNNLNALNAQTKRKLIIIAVIAIIIIIVVSIVASIVEFEEYIKYYDDDNSYGWGSGTSLIVMYHILYVDLTFHCNTE